MPEDRSFPHGDNSNKTWGSTIVSLSLSLSNKLKGNGWKGSIFLLFLYQTIRQRPARWIFHSRLSQYMSDAELEKKEGKERKETPLHSRGLHHQISPTLEWVVVVIYLFFLFNCFLLSSRVQGKAVLFVSQTRRRATGSRSSVGQLLATNNRLDLGKPIRSTTSKDVGPQSDSTNSGRWHATRWQRTRPAVESCDWIHLIKTCSDIEFSPKLIQTFTLRLLKQSTIALLIKLTIKTTSVNLVDWNCSRNLKIWMNI